MRIAADAMGGDHGCQVVVDGLLQALEQHSQIEYILVVGDKSQLGQALGQAGNSDSRIEIIHAPEILTMDDKPVEGLRRKKNCSLAVAMDLVKRGDADAIISPGNTGGIVAAASIKLRTLPGVDRPGIAAVCPRNDGNFILLDAGASVDGKPRHLMHYAIMGDIYAREVLGVSRPKVGLLSVGTEANKGDELTQEAFNLCRELDLDFIGNVEGHDLFHKSPPLLPVSVPGDLILEVTFDGFLPSVIQRLFPRSISGPSAISKYMLCRPHTRRWENGQ